MCPDPFTKNLVCDTAYANKDVMIARLYQCMQIFNLRRETFSISDKANLADGAVWLISITLKWLPPRESERNRALDSDAQTTPDSLTIPRGLKKGRHSNTMVAITQAKHLLRK